MKTIEIITAQNVVLQYELAGWKDRVFAFLIDTITLTISLSILLGIGVAIFSGSETMQTVVITFLTCVFIFYSLAFEVWNNGQSLGKMALRIQVIKVAGGQATFSDYFARWVFRMVDIYFSFGAIASILIMSSSKGQRIGDVVANSAVVKTAPKMNLDLKDLLTLHERSNYVPRYQQARKLHEEDALLIKQTIDRYRKFRNDSHIESLALVTEKVKSVLDIETNELDHLKFLQTVLQDYVILTR